MNQSERNFRDWLIHECSIDPDSITFQPHTTPDFITPAGQYIVKKRYGDKMILHTSQEASYIEQETDTGSIALMPEDPDERSEPLAIIPVAAVGDATGLIPYSTVEAHAVGTVPFWTEYLSFQLAYEGAMQKQHFRLDAETLGVVTRIIEDNPHFENRSQFYRFAVRTAASDETEFEKSE